MTGYLLYYGLSEIRMKNPLQFNGMQTLIPSAAISDEIVYPLGEVKMSSHFVFSKLMVRASLGRELSSYK